MVTERGAARPPAALDPAVRARIEALAAEVVALPASASRSTAFPVSDDLATQVEIEVGGQSASLDVHSGDELPPPVLELLAAVRGLLY